MHLERELTTSIVRELVSLSYSIILEDLKGIKERTGRKASRRIRCRLIKWDAKGDDHLRMMSPYSLKM